MINLTFKEWIVVEEIRSLLTTLMEDSLQAALLHNNMMFSQAFGVQKNWFAMILAQAKNYAKGGDILTVASEAASEMLMSLHAKNPADKFWLGVKQILSLDDQTKEGQLMSFFTAAASMRARRFGQQYHKASDKNTHTMSSLSDLSAGSSIRGNSRSSLAVGSSMKKQFDIADTRAKTGEENNRVKELRQSVFAELGKMAAGANDKRSRERLILAKQVAAKALENPPELMPVDDLAALFPDISRGYIQKMRDEIKQALCTVLSDQGIHAKDCIMLKSKAKEVA